MNAKMKHRIARVVTSVTANTINDLYGGSVDSGLIEDREFAFCDCMDGKTIYVRARFQINGAVHSGEEWIDTEEVAADPDGMWMSDYSSQMIDQVIYGMTRAAQQREAALAA